MQFKPPYEVKTRFGTSGPTAYSRQPMLSSRQPESKGDTQPALEMQHRENHGLRYRTTPHPIQYRTFRVYKLLTETQQELLPAIHFFAIS